MALVVAGALAAQFLLLDGLDGFAWSILVNAPTEYSSGYSDGGFRRVKIGDSSATVVRELGEPIKKQTVERSAWPRPVEYWEYSQSKTGGSYRRRQILFDVGGVVIDKHSYFDVD